MKFPESWLRSLVAPTVDTEALCHRLTMIGLEVEGSETLGAALEGVVVAELVACRPHPEADRLQVCDVSIGSETLQIVCGAPNARPGLKAPLARIGARLPDGTEIRSARLRGVESSGMLCSARELGIDADASGLLELPEDAVVGRPLAESIGLPDTIIELGLTPNRGDCFSLRGIAADVAAAFDAKLTSTEIPSVPATIEAVLPVCLEAGADCPRYCGRVIEGLDTSARTPHWIAERLRRCGLRPISLLVDITNYVMLELGQPMHAFDRDALKGGIRVRRGASGETLKLLDGRSIELDAGLLVIADEAQPVALAGVMGGWDTRVVDGTRTVFLESAHFAPDAIIGRARRFGLHTDAAHRFERGVDPQLPATALEYATRLIIDAAGGQPGPVVEARLDAYLPSHQPVRLRRARLSRLLGLEIADGDVERILAALDMQVQRTADGWLATPPSRRFDVAIEEDLIEEVARIHGYERIPSRPPSGQLTLGGMPESRIEADLMRQQLAARGYFEAINFAFLDGETLRHWRFDSGLIELANPLSAELGVMRPSLLPGLVKALQHNLARQESRPRLFEIGRSFAAGEEGPVETVRLAAVACGDANDEQWAVRQRPLDFYDIKGDLESVFQLTGTIANFRYSSIDLPWAHPGRSARICVGEDQVGVVGFLHPALARALDLGRDVALFEVDLTAIGQREVPRAASISRYPSVRRDLSVVVDRNVPWATMEQVLREALGERLVQVVLFDEYQGEGLQPASRSLAIGLILQDVSRTLADEDAEWAVAEALAALARSCGAKLRG